MIAAHIIRLSCADGAALIPIHKESKESELVALQAAKELHQCEIITPALLHGMRAQHITDQSISIWEITTVRSSAVDLPYGARKALPNRFGIGIEKSALHQEFGGISEIAFG